MGILLSKNIAQCDDRARPCSATTARRDDRAAVGWAWTGRNVILDEALRSFIDIFCMMKVAPAASTSRFLGGLQGYIHVYFCILLCCYYYYVPVSE